MVEADGNPSATAVDAPAVVLEERAEKVRRRRDRILWRRPSPAGLAVAFVFFGFSLTPSLVPREPPVQAIVSGLGTISGYALGATVGAVLRRFGFRVTWRPSRPARLVVVGVAAASMLTIMILGANWQNDLRDLMGMPHVGPGYGVVVPVALTMSAALLLVARFIRWAAIRLGEFIDRWLPRRMAMLIASVIVAFLVFSLVNGLLLARMLDGLRASFSIVDEGTPEGVVQPMDPERSGSPASLVSWESLGRQGRVFVAGGPTVEELAAFAAAPMAKESGMKIGIQKRKLGK